MDRIKKINGLKGDRSDTANDLTIKNHVTNLTFAVNLSC